MAKTKLYLDTRHVSKNGTCPVKLQVNKKGATALISLGFSIMPNQWDKEKGQVTNHPNKAFYNAFMQSRKVQIDKLLIELTESGVIAGMNATQLKNALQDAISPKEVTPNIYVMPYFEKVMQLKKEGTKGAYRTTYNHMIAYCKVMGVDASKLTFEQANRTFFMSFHQYLVSNGIKPNTCLLYFRVLKCIFNTAIDDNITALYPFRKFSIKPAPTKKRNLSLERLRELFEHRLSNKRSVQKAVDMMMLDFMLIGINMKDLYYAKLEDVINNRLNYQRAKTSKSYSIMIMPEAWDIINKYKGKTHLLKFADECPNYRNLLARTNIVVQRIGTTASTHDAVPDDAPYKDITTYWMRHTWATIAHEIGISKDVISMALGHSSGIRVTDVYIEYDLSKVDDANRKVIDYVFYSHLPG